MTEPELDTAEQDTGMFDSAMFDADYLYFYESIIGDTQSDADIELIRRLLDPEPGTEVLDLPCGHGRIANRLAARSCRVTGVDIAPVFLNRARRDAAECGVAVDYRHGDMRALPWTERFDLVVNWFTSFGYFGDEDNRLVLREIERVLRPGGRLIMEMSHLVWQLANFKPTIVVERDRDFLIDRNQLDPLTGRNLGERTVIRGGSIRRMRFSLRLLTFTELRDWLLEAGFDGVTGHDEHGDQLGAQSRRMILVAQKPVR